MAVSTIRSWWNDHQRENLDSKTEEEEDELPGRKQLVVSMSETLRTRQLLINFDGGRPVWSLRAPLELVNFPSNPRPQWPIECEVINDVIHHIEWEPPEPEPFYQPTGHERTPMPVEEQKGKVVYCIDHATKQPYFTCSRVGGSSGRLKNATCGDRQTETLEFESRFESGNLQKAVQVGVYAYELTLRTDLYTTKNTQWFYFRVRNMKAGASYCFTIVNLMKSSSLYSVGMRPLLYSERAAEENGVGWQRAGSNIRYYPNRIQIAKGDDGDHIALYSLSWTLQFAYDSDTCFLAHCYPYTYSRLQRYLGSVSSNPAVASYCKVRVLCHSLAGNAVYVLTITSLGAGRPEGKARKGVVVTARVHPGETNGSWMMEGLLDFLLGDSDDAQLLRDTFVFKVVPMLNPDGVVVGNSRCSLAGRDLNRNYRTLLRDSFPCVWHTRNMVERLLAERDVVLYCDFHGHSRKDNVFMYGCNSRGNVSLKLHERVFPLMMSKNACNKFSFRSCKFRVQKSKEGTGRIVMWRLGIKNSYTMEATFGGSTLGDRTGTHFTTQDLKSLGFYFCDTLLDYCDPDSTKNMYCQKELRALLRKQIRKRLGTDLGSDCRISVSDLETSTSGSNSSDSDGLPVHLLNQPTTATPRQTAVKKKKRRLRSRRERNKLLSDREKNSLQPKVQQIHISSKNNSPHDDSAKKTVAVKPDGRPRRKWRSNGLVGEAGIPPTDTHPGGLSLVTLVQGCQHASNTCPEQISGPDLRNGPKASPSIGTYSPHTGDAVVDTRRWRCPSQLLQLSALLLPSPNCSHSKHQQHRGNRQRVASYKAYRGLSPASTSPHRSPSFIRVQTLPDVVSPTCLLSSFDAVKFSGHIFRDRSTLRVSERYLVTDVSSTDRNKSDHRREERECSSKVAKSLPRCEPVMEQNRKHNTPLKESESSGNVFAPWPRDPRGKQQCKDSTKDKRHSEVLPPLSKPSGLQQPRRDALSGLQRGDARRGGGSQTSPQEATLNRQPQSVQSQARAFTK